MTEPNYALEQAKAQYDSICDMVAALEVDYVRLDALKAERADLVSEAADYTNVEQGLARAALTTWDFDKGEELVELLEAADGCENQGAARDRIQEDPLSVQVRSGWMEPGQLEQECKRVKNHILAEEFEILLCTGGPAVRIMGGLDARCQPYRAWLEYQDWGTPWTRYFDAEQNTLLAYANEFYFGG